MASGMRTIAIRFTGDTKGLEQASSQGRSALGKWQDKFASFAGKAGPYMAAAAAAVGIVTVAIKTAIDTAKKLYRVGEMFDDMIASIVVGTGASGKALDGLKKTAENIATSIPVDFKTAGQAVSDLNTITGMTGRNLKRSAAGILDASRLLGEDGTSNVKSFGKALKQWQIPAKQGRKEADRLFRATQQYGVGLGQITDELNAYGSILQNAGFTMDESVTLFGKLEKSGLSVSRLMPGLNMAFRKWSDAGKNSRVELAKTIDKMKGAKTSTEALKIATKAFGAEGAQRLTTAVRNGSFALDGLTKKTDKSKGSIKRADRQTRTWKESWQILKNKGLKAVEPIASTVFKAVTKFGNWLNDTGVPALQSFAKVVKHKFVGALKEANAVNPFKHTLKFLRDFQHGFSGNLTKIQRDAHHNGIDWHKMLSPGEKAGLKARQGDWTSAIQNLVDFIADQLQKVDWSRLGDTLGTMLGDALGKSQVAVAKITAAVAWIASQINWVQVAGAFAYGGAQLSLSLATGFVGGFNEAVYGAVKGAVTRAFHAVINWAKGILGIHSPSKVFRGIGRDLVLGFARGITATVAVPLAAARALGRKALAIFAPAGHWLVSHGVAFARGLSSGIRSGTSLAVSAARTAGQRTQDVFNGAPSWLVDPGRDVIRGLSSGMHDEWAKVKSWISGIAGWVKKHKGPVSLDAKLLVPAGRAMMKGFKTGLLDEWLPIDKWIKSIGGGIGGGVKRWAPLVLRALKMLHQPSSLLGAVLHRMNQESGGNPNIVNRWDINARRGTPSMGLMQTIGPTFSAYAGPFRKLGITNPFANIYAGLNYALHRYHSLRYAMLKPGGYDSGGWLPPPVNGTGKPEAVLNNEQSAAFVGLAQALTGGGSLVLEVDGHQFDAYLLGRQAEDDRGKRRRVLAGAGRAAA